MKTRGLQGKIEHDTPNHIISFHITSFGMIMDPFSFVLHRCTRHVIVKGSSERETNTRSSSSRYRRVHSSSSFHHRSLWKSPCQSTCRRLSFSLRSPFRSFSSSLSFVTDSNPSFVSYPTTVPTVPPPSITPLDLALDLALSLP